MIRNDGNQPNIMTNDEYDQILEKSKEFLAAKKGLGPYVSFGLSNIHDKLTLAIGYYLTTFLNLL